MHLRLAILAVLRLEPQSLGLLAPVCSSMGWLVSSLSKRSFVCPLGDPSVDFVSAGNLLALRPLSMVSGSKILGSMCPYWRVGFDLYYTILHYIIYIYYTIILYYTILYYIIYYTILNIYFTIFYYALIQSLVLGFLKPCPPGQSSYAGYWLHWAMCSFWNSHVGRISAISHSGDTFASTLPWILGSKTMSPCFESCIFYSPEYRLRNTITQEKPTTFGISSACLAS